MMINNHLHHGQQHEELLWILMNGMNYSPTLSNNFQFINQSIVQQQQQNTNDPPDILFIIFQVIFVIFNFLSIAGSIIVFIVFFLEKTNLFTLKQQRFDDTSSYLSTNNSEATLNSVDEGNFVDSTNYRLGRNSFSLVIKNEQNGSTTIHSRKSFSNSNNSSLFNRKKKQFIRRTMLMLCISDLLFSSSNILFTVWSWCVEYAPALNVQNGEISNVTWILSHAFAHGNFAFALCSATWSVSIAIAIYTTTKKVKWMEENYVYDILFHIISWGVALISFISLFSYRVSAKLTGFHDEHPEIEIYVLTFFNFFGAFYLIMAAILDFSILFLIWKHVGHILSKTQLRIVVKKETKRAQRRIVRKLSLYLIPFLISSSFQSVWLLYNGCKYLVGRNDDNFEYYFYLLYSIFVPLQGFLNFLVYGLTLGRSSLVKMLRCDCLRSKHDHSEERDSLLSINQNNLNSFNSSPGRERSSLDLSS